MIAVPLFIAVITPVSDTNAVSSSFDLYVRLVWFAFILCFSPSLSVTFVSSIINDSAVVVVTFSVVVCFVVVFVVVVVLALVVCFIIPDVYALVVVAAVVVVVGFDVVKQY